MEIRLPHNYDEEDIKFFHFGTYVNQNLKDCIKVNKYKDITNYIN